MKPLAADRQPPRRLSFGRWRPILVGAFAAVLAGGAGILAASGASPSRPVTVQRELYLMGTHLSLEVAGRDRATALAGSEAAVRALEAAEARLSTWTPESELAHLDTAPAGTGVALSATLARELGEAFACARDTAGAFDPAVGALVDAWGLRGEGRVPSAAELATALAASRPSALSLDGATAVRRTSRLRIEEGGWGKGAGLDAALATLAGVRGVSAAWLDLGGQAAVLGEVPWTTAVADPDDRSRPVVALALDGGSLSTSGNSEHGLVVDGRRIGHLLDPSSGRPAADFGSLTVWAPRALRADCLSTGLYVMGPRRALAWAAAHAEEGIEVLALERAPEGLRVRASAGLAGRVRPLVPDLDMSFGEEPGGGAPPGKTKGATGRSLGSAGPLPP